MSNADLDTFLQSPIEGRLRDRLEERSARYDELTGRVADPASQSDSQKFQALLKEQGSIAPAWVVNAPHGAQENE